MENRGRFTLQRLIILSGLLFALLNQTYSQKTKITEDTFIVQVEALYKGIPSDKSEPIVKGINSWWTTESNPSVKSELVETFSRLVERKLNAHPDISSFFEAFFLMRGKLDSEQLIRWLRVNRHLLEEEASGRYLQYVQASKSVIADSTLIKTSLAIWKTNNSDFSIASDTSTGFFFPKTEIICQTRMPGNSIRATSGTFRPLSKTWEGKHGVLTWEKFNFPPDSLYVTLGRYSINLQLPEFQADSADFVHKLLQNSVKG